MVTMAPAVIPGTRLAALRIEPAVNTGSSWAKAIDRPNHRNVTVRNITNLLKSRSIRMRLRHAGKPRRASDMFAGQRISIDRQLIVEWRLLVEWVKNRVVVVQTRRQALIVDLRRKARILKVLVRVDQTRIPRNHAIAHETGEDSRPASI